MNIIITIIVIIVAIIGLILLVALFVSKEYKIERGVLINKPKSEIFNYVKLQKNQDNYSKWVMADPNAKKEYKGTDGTVGFAYAWDSENKNVGKGEQQIKKIIDGEKIELEIHFIRPFEGVAHTHMTTQTQTGNQTLVTWGMQGKSKYPLNIMNLFIPGVLEKDLDISLNNLKLLHEK
jgi:hypothetical protein